VRRVSGFVAALAVVLVSVNLRPGAASVGPVLAEVSDGLGMSPGVAGVVTGLPGLCFGLGGAVAVTLARRVGTTAGIAIGMLVATVGLVLRATATSTTLFLVLTTVALAGMALGNVLVPAWIKAHSTRSVLLPTLYTVGLTGGSALAAALTAPVAEAAGGWRAGIGLWGGTMGLALPLWVWLAVREGRVPPPERGAGGAPRRIASSPTALAMAALFGVQSMQAYVQYGWLPQIYRDAGVAPSTAGVLLALLSAIGIAGALLMPTVIARSRTLSPWMLGFGIMMALGYVGLLLAPATLPWLWALLLGLAGWAFPTSIALLTARTRTSAVTARLSGFVQPVGYALAAIGPLLVGLLHDATGDWDLVLVLLALTAVPFTWAGLRAARRVWVDDELAA